MPIWNRLKYAKVKCPDGTVLNVYHKADDAFPIKDNKIEMKLYARLNSVLEHDVKIGGKLKRKSKRLLDELDTRNYDLINYFHSAYVVYHSNPCKNIDYLRETIDKIINSHQKLRNNFILIEKFIQTIQNQPQKPEKITREYMELEKSIYPYKNEVGEAFKSSLDALEKLK